jgi:DNA-binding CsgD family transcriptional regulator/PAS domain-containing protein
MISVTVNWCTGAAAVSVDPAILTAIDEIYAAALDESRWPKVMQEILALTDSVAATFCAIDGADEPRFSTFTTLNFEKAFVDEYTQGMMVHDPTVRYIVAHPHQRLVHDSQLITEREKDRHFYYDWHHSFSDTRHRLAGMVSVEDNVSSGITVHRTRQQGDYQSGHIQRFEFLLPHLERAVSLAFRLGTFGAMQQMTFHLLDANPLGIIVLDERIGVIFANRAARAFTAAQDGLALSTEGLRLCGQRDNGKLQNLIDRALGLAQGEKTRPAGTMQALRPSGKRPLSILVAPLCRAAFVLTWARPAVCIVIADPEREAEVPDQVLRTIYGLTPAEARLAIKIASGMRLQRAADELAISYATARTQLVAVFRKTSTSRQGELVKLLLSELPVL